MYHADTSRIGKSGLDLIAEAPAKYYAKYLDPNRKKEEPTEALIIGSAFHCLTLEPELFPTLYVVSEKFSGEGSKARRKEFLEANANKKPISIDDYNRISRMRDAVMNHPACKLILTGGIVEKRIDWQDPATDALCKAKPDYYATEHNFIVDLKSTEDASEQGFMRSAYTHRYHVQAPWYLDGAILNGMNPQGFLFIAVEKEPPYLVNVFSVTDQMFSHGRQIYHRDLTTYMDCVMSGRWPGYSPDTKPLGMPQWVMNNL